MGVRLFSVCAHRQTFGLCVVPKMLFRGKAETLNPFSPLLAKFVHKPTFLHYHVRAAESRKKSAKSGKIWGRWIFSPAPETTERGLRGFKLQTLGPAVSAFHLAQPGLRRQRTGRFADSLRNGPCISGAVSLSYGKKKRQVARLTSFFSEPYPEVQHRSLLLRATAFPVRPWAESGKI